MKVVTDEKIIELSTGKVLIVECGFDSEKDIKPSEFFDFSARYMTRAGITKDGQEVFANRGFSLNDEGVVWCRLKD